MPTLRDAALDQQEREVVDRFVAALQKVYGEDLDAVWLYGSPARGDPMHEESDIDILVVTGAERSDEPLFPVLWRVLDGLGSRASSSTRGARSRAWIEDRRALDSFFLREVDRDKIVLYGSP